MVQVCGHGGLCCGRAHLYGFGYHDTLTEDRLRATMAGWFNPTTYDNAYPDFGDRGISFEVVLTDHQIERMPNTIKALKQVGFKLVQRYINSNSGRTLYLFLYHRAPKSITNASLPPNLKGFNTPVRTRKAA